ncbi:hypothetical protein [Nonomuraea sp. NPDC049480]|uniref:hypothetical protein n=1 Tax=Nonomuraea sp. NPDC049480 TaxID=3364353 RepID=UPI00379FF595
MSGSASHAGVSGRLLTWVVAATMACGAVGMSGATASAHAATESTAGTAHKQVNRLDGPGLDSAFVPLTTAPGILEGYVFLVTADRGHPRVYDPRAAAGQRWVSLRRIENSQGGYVTNISIASEGLLGGAGVQDLLIRARTAAGLYETRCTVQEVLDVVGIPTDTAVPFPPTGDLTNCDPWEAITP